MRDRESAGAPARLALPAELLLLDRLPRIGRAAAGLLAVGVALGWGFAALAIHQHELDLRDAGSALSPMGTLFADASSPLTAWPGWAIAAILGLSAARLRGGALEPPAGRGNPRELTAAELRAGLRREYTGARWALIVLGVLTLADLARLAVSGVSALASVAGAGDGLAWMGVETGGLVAATAALIAWLLSFRGQLERIGALSIPHVRRPPGAAEG
jgi:hypothetical protein